MGALALEEPILLLDTVPRVTAELALNLLDAEGIPALLRGPDFDVAELGAFAHDMLRGVSVYVAPRGFASACDVLDQAWGRRWREKESSALALRAGDASRRTAGVEEDWRRLSQPIRAIGRLLVVLVDPITVMLATFFPLFRRRRAKPPETASDLEREVPRAKGEDSS